MKWCWVVLVKEMGILVYIGGVFVGMLGFIYCIFWIVLVLLVLDWYLYIGFIKMWSMVLGWNYF